MKKMLYLFVVMVLLPISAQTLWAGRHYPNAVPEAAERCMEDTIALPEIYVYLYRVNGELIADNDPATAPGADVVLPEAAPMPDVCYADGSCSGCLVWDRFYTDVRFSDGTRDLTRAGLKMTNAIETTHNNATYWFMGDNELTVYLLSDDQTPALRVRRRITPKLPALTILAPDTIRLPSCQQTVRAPLILSQGDYLCAGLEYQRIEADFGGMGARYIGARRDQIEYEMLIAAPGEYNITFDYNDIFGQNTTASKTVVVVADAEDLPPVIALTSAPDTVYFSACETGAAIYEFAVRDDCAPVNSNDVYFLSDSPELSLAQGEDLYLLPGSTVGHQLFRLERRLSQAGVYNVQIGYGGQVLNQSLVVVERAAEPLRLVWPGTDTLRSTIFYDISACDSCGLWVNEIILEAPCGGIANEDFSFDLDGEPFFPEPTTDDVGTFQIFQRICTPQTHAVTLNIRCEIPGGPTYTFSRPVSLSFAYAGTAAPILSKPSEPLALTLNACINQPVTAWLGTGLVESCREQAQVQEIAPAGINIIQVGPSLSLLRSAQAGQYAIGLEVADGSAVLARDSVLVMVTASSGDPANCPEEIPVALVENGLGQLTPADILGEDALCLSASDYVVTVQDGQPDNGGQIDGCGAYPFALYYAADQPATGLSGILAPEHWAVWRSSLSEVTFDAQAINVLRHPAALAYTFARDGSLSFAYSIPVSLNQPSWQLRLYDAAGQLLAAWEDQPAGVVDQNVAEGQTLVISVPGSNDATTFSNWQFTPAAPGAPICSGTVIAEDTTPPTTAIAPEAEVVLSASGLTEIGATELDAGSADNCGPITQQLRRQYTRDPLTCATVAPYFGPWGETVDFNCCDACEAVAVEVRTTDGAGLESVAAASVFVRDDRQPVITAFEIEPACCPNPEACQGAFQYSFRAESGCNVRRPTVTVALDLNADGSPDADLAAATVPQPNNRYKITGWTAPEGQHALLLSAVDGCGNIAAATVPFQVLDCSGEAPPIIMLSDGSYGLPQGIDQPLLLPGQPNPFTDQTVLRYWLPAEGEAQLQVLDAAGRQVLMRGGAHDAGWQEWLLTAADLPAAGIYTVVLYYRGQALRQRVARL